ncbi:MAG: glycosyltransferase family 25 protein, partial [Patescibacteria group bacterium]|nr:glycosyltransferase family 25 protein [Patescibacteria group bacterium]
KPGGTPMQIDDLPKPAIIHLSDDQSRWNNIQSQIFGWPLKPPMIFPAYSNLPTPGWWKAGGGAWGCRLSHLELMAKAIQSNTTAFVMEDDFLLCDGFAEKLEQFLAVVPQDWQGLWIGGLHIEKPRYVNADVVRNTNTQCNQCYLLRGQYLRDCWVELQRFDQHIDWLTGSKMSSPSYPVYSPVRWLVGQSAGYSHIRRKTLAERWFNPL